MKDILPALHLRAPEEAQLVAERRQGIGGSDVAAIVGVHPYKTPHDVWLDKVGLADPVTSEAAYWGTILEPIIGREYALREGVEVLRPTPRFSVHKTEPWIIGHPDYVVAGQPVGLDCKTTNLRQAPRWGDPGTDDIPEEALLQAQWYLALDEGAERWDIAVLLGQEFRIYRVRPNSDLQRIVIDQCGDFWVRYVVLQTPPPVDHSESARKMLQKVFPYALGAVRSATDQELAWALNYRDVLLRLDALDTQRDLLGNRLREAIGDDAGIEGDFGKITWKRVKDSERTDWEAVARLLWFQWSLQADSLRIPNFNRDGFAEIVTEHTTMKPGVRRFLPKFNDKEPVHD